MKYISMAITALWFMGWFFVGYFSSGIGGLTLILTLIFPSFVLGYILCWETEKGQK